MKRLNIRGTMDSLRVIYNLRDPDAKGRLISLGEALLTAIFNVFITGIFYTGFLTMYDIPITGVGIISFIPQIASCMSVFSSIVLERFKKRKTVLLWSKVYFYFMYIIATNLMPNFVTDPDLRLILFAVILFMAYAVYAVFNPGFTTWFYFFYPKDNERRTRYISYNQTFSSIMSSIVLLVSGFITDAVSGSPFQKQLIIGLRYFAFALVLIEVWMQAQAIEYDYPPAPKIRLSQVFTLPFKYKKFMMCLLFIFYWNFNSNLNGGTWSYHLLNHLHFSYTLINAMSVMYTILLVLLGPFWRRVLRRFSWIKTFGLCCVIWVPTEIIAFFLTQRTAWMYIPMSFFQNILNIGLNFSFANVLYMNLPSENSTTHIAFYCLGANLFAFLGNVFGTWVAGLTGDVPITLLGMEFYSVQYTTLMRAVLMAILGVYLVKEWRLFTRDEDIAEIEDGETLIREQKQKRKMMRGRK